ncbi:multiple epidermal growth factor-like domains protein 10 [Haliotis rufescens]|uniref:multiple epidermal growth factor-like domains protein 10 n=1 Tax=Haliotis rufescens TaxID=6454 RepID=UPI00201E8DF4|nr:multiple epidermal growth factor-like domains protein 10 [Haliotis rufescens]
MYLSHRCASQSFSTVIKKMELAESSIHDPKLIYVFVSTFSFILPEVIALSTCDGGCYNLACSSCNTGCFGISCKNPCSDLCKSSVCEKENGVCLSCIDGYYTKNCDTKCPVNCANNTCQRNNGTCSHHCIEGWYGRHCNRSCPGHCKYRACNMQHGKCDDGCSALWSGNYCNITCQHCLQSLCATKLQCNFVCENGTLCDRTCRHKYSSSMQYSVALGSCTDVRRDRGCSVSCMVHATGGSSTVHVGITLLLLTWLICLLIHLTKETNPSQTASAPRT